MVYVAAEGASKGNFEVLGRRSNKHPENAPKTHIFESWAAGWVVGGGCHIQSTTSSLGTLPYCCVCFVVCVCTTEGLLLL